MTTSEIGALGVSYVYALGLIAIGELLRRRLGVAADLTRKVIHIGAGMWVFGVLALFDRWQVGIIPFASFILLNYLFYRLRLFRSMEATNNTPGTVYFAIAITLLFLAFWRPEGPIDRAPVAVAGAMALTWGDALAALVGRAAGRHRYQVGRSQRSWEGSAVMFVTSLLVIGAALAFVPESPLSPAAPPIAFEQIVLATLLGAGAATLAEATSPHGTDNLSVPLLAACVIWLVIR